MGDSVPDVNLAVKNTFLEYETRAQKPARSRAFTDTALLREGEDSDDEGGSEEEHCEPSPELPGNPVEQPKDSPLVELASPSIQAWPCTPLMEAIFEPRPLGVGCGLDGVNMEATMEVKSVLGMDGIFGQGAELGFDTWLPDAACDEMQDPLMFQQPWSYMPYADYSTCGGVQDFTNMWYTDPKGEVADPEAWLDTGVPAWQPACSSTAAGSDCSTTGSSEAAEAGNSATETRTTIMLRNIPITLTRANLLEMLDAMGFLGLYDLVYIPVDFSTGEGLGYAFINVCSSSTVGQLWETFDGLSTWNTESGKVCTVSWSNPHQGLAAHIERYQNSPVMHPDVPDDWKPALFVQGTRVEFPAPTKKLKAPKVRSKGKADSAGAFAVSA